MARYFLSGGKKAVSAVSALLAATLLITGCNPTADAGNPVTGKDIIVPPGGGTTITNPVIIPDPPINPIAPAWDTIQLMVRTSPLEPQNERFLDDWRFRIVSIDDQARQASPIYFGETGPDGNGLVGLPSYMFALPLVISAYNEVLPLINDDDDDGDFGQCQLYEVFIPPYCHDKAVWMVGPFEAALWDFYEEAAERRAEAWNPSQVDCGTWLANLQLLILTDEVVEELTDIDDDDVEDDFVFSQAALIDALQENQHLLVPTRPPICMAERRHNGGGMERGDAIDVEGSTIIIDDFVAPFGPTEVDPDDDPITVSLTNGIVSNVCTSASWTTQSLSVNSTAFVPTADFILDDEDFMGTVHDQPDILPNIDVSSYNVRVGNGRELDSDIYDDACAYTGIVQFTNKDDDEQDILTGTGITFGNLFDGDGTSVFLTSDGDAVVDDNDYWAIFSSDAGEGDCDESVIAVELIGHRQEDFRDVLHMTYDATSENLFLGLRADYELNEEEVDGERAFLAYTISIWDGSTEDGRAAVRENIANCYESADVWARQFFVTADFDNPESECCLDEDCEIDDVICPLEAAEFAVRSQCFSNSRANQRWRTDDAGFWSMNTDHGVHGNVIINPGWLAPDLDFEIYVQKFDEAVFKGPRTIRRTDSVGQLMAELPTLVEGDRVLIKAEDNCCDDYDLVLPCVPEFTGFAGAPGVPFVPQTLGPPPVLPALPVTPVVGLPAVPAVTVPATTVPAAAATEKPAL